MESPPIYVEIRIRGDLSEIWRRTQTPEEHQRWDLRFTDIEYLPRPDPAAPQQFLYATRIGFGLRIAGAGESVGENHGPAGRVSALKFWSDDPKSLIREGSGYWKYVPTDDGQRFLTRYDYRTRFGITGAVVDRWLFRPLLGWATAWSFDRLRLWIERGIDPAVALERSVIHASSRLALAIIWLYQGIVPKVIYQDSGELDILRGSGAFPGREAEVLVAIGFGEIAFGLLHLLLWRWRGLFAGNIVLLLLLASGAAVSQPSVFLQPFNPTTLTIGMAALSVVGLLSQRHLPSARRCLRREPRSGA